MQWTSRFFFIFSMLIVGWPAVAEERLQPRIEGTWMPSDDRTIWMSEFWFPLIQDYDEGHVLYGDYRMVGDNQDSREFNVGVGYRKITQFMGLKGISGGHLWFDRRRTARESNFNQVTLGAEWFGENLDLKLNTYIPLNDSKTHIQSNPNGTNGRFSGNQIVINTDQIVVEEALKGLDLELGWRVPILDNYTDSSRLYLGVYHFEGNLAEDVSGWRTRFSSDITSNFKLGARFQHDDVRGSQGFLEATFRFPLEHKKSYRKDGLRARLDESPERDIDVVSNEIITEDGNDQVLLNADTGSTQHILHVDNTAAGGGNGSIETPYNTLAAAEAAAGANDLIYVARGDGTTTGQSDGIVLNDDGQMLIGSGTHLSFNNSAFSTGNGLGVSASNVLIAADAAGGPVITNGAGDGVNVSAADDITLSGFTIDGASTNGILASYNSANNFSLAISDVITQNNTGDGLDIRTSNDANLTADINNVTAHNNGAFGVFSFFQGNGLGNIDLKNTTMTMNTRAGSRVSIRDGFDADMIFDGNTAQNNGEYGLELRSEGTGTLSSTLVNNTASDNTDSGFYIRVISGQSIAKIESNTLTGNTDHGIFIDDDSGLVPIIDIGGGSLGSIGQNIIHSNTSTDIRVDLDGEELKAENNWWGVNTGLDGAETTLDAGSSIDADPFLTSAPNN